jgi:hypothetical protein
MLKTLKRISDGADCGNKKCKRSYGGVRRSLRLAGVWRWAIGFFLVGLVEIWLQSPSMFPRLIQFENKFYKFSTFNAI